MVQVLPYVPSFLEQLTPHIKQATSDVASTLEQRSALKGLKSLMNANQNAAQEEAGAQSAVQGESGINTASPLDTVQAFKLAEKALGPQGAKVFVDSLMQQQKLKEREAVQIRKEERAEKRAGIAKRAEATIGTRDSINAQRRNLLSARAAVQTGDVGAFSKSSIADLFGEAGKRFKDASAAQLDAATKHLLITSLGDVTAKGTNLWLEKVALSAAPGLGKTNEANEALITIALGELDIKEKKLDVEQELLAQYEKQGIKPPVNFDKIVDDLVKPYAKQVQEKTAYDTRVIYERESGRKLLDKNIKVPKGTPLTLAKRDALLKQFKGDKEKAKGKAIELGYTIPDPSIVLAGENQ